MHDPADRDPRYRDHPGQRRDRAEAQERRRQEAGDRAEPVADQAGRQQGQGRRDDRDDRRRRRQVHQDEAGQERPGDRAERPERVDVADGAAGLARLLDGDLGDDRPDHPEDRPGDQEVDRDQGHGPEPVRQALLRDVAADRVEPEAGQRQGRAEGIQRADHPRRVGPVRQPAAEDVAQADPAEHDPDHAGPDVQGRPDVPRHQPAGHQFEDHDAEAAEEGQRVGQHAVSGGGAVHCGGHSTERRRGGSTLGNSTQVIRATDRPQPPRGPILADRTRPDSRDLRLPGRPRRARILAGLSMGPGGRPPVDARTPLPLGPPADPG